MHKCPHQRDPSVFQSNHCTRHQPSENDFFEEEIPEDIFSDKLVETMTFTCNSTNLHLRIDPNAFRSTRNHTDTLWFENCNLHRVNSKFMEGFDNLRYLTYYNSSNVQPAVVSLPNLPNLKQLYIARCANDFDSNLEYNASSILSPMLKELLLPFTNWPDDVIDWILGFFSQNLPNIEFMDLEGNAMRRIPPDVARINAYWQFFCWYNTVPMKIDTGSFYFEYPLAIQSNTRDLLLAMSNVVDIQPGAFQGNFSFPTRIFLIENHLTRFEENVFYPVLEQFAISGLNNPPDKHEISIDKSKI